MDISYTKKGHKLVITDKSELFYFSNILELAFFHLNEQRDVEKNISMDLFNNNEKIRTLHKEGNLIKIQKTENGTNIITVTDTILEDLLLIASSSLDIGIKFKDLLQTPYNYENMSYIKELKAQIDALRNILIAERIQF